MNDLTNDLLDAELRGRLSAYVEAWTEGQITAERAMQGVRDALAQRAERVTR